MHAAVILHLDVSKMSPVLRSTRIRGSDQWFSSMSVAADWAVGQNDWSGRDVRNYRQGYRALRTLFADFLDLEDRLSVLACANAIYGWMPTILNTVDYDMLETCHPVLSGLRKAESASAAYTLLEELDPTVRAGLLRTINNSVVGTSKFLHFLNPAGLPIWDSRVLRALGGKPAAVVNCDRKYMTYVHAVIQFLDRFDAWPGPGPYQTFLAEGDDIGPSRLRMLEYALFQHKGVGGRASGND